MEEKMINIARVGMHHFPCSGYWESHNLKENDRKKLKKGDIIQIPAKLFGAFTGIRLVSPAEIKKLSEEVTSKETVGKKTTNNPKK